MTAGMSERAFARLQRDHARRDASRLEAQLDRIEAVLIKRAGYTDEPPREGLEGMVLALEDALDERDRQQVILRRLTTLAAVQFAVLLLLVMEGLG